MKKNIALCLMLLFGISFNGISQEKKEKLTQSFMIRHTVVFTLKYPKDSPEEKVFLDAIRKLTLIPGVQKFECLRQVSKKNNFDYGLSMEFSSIQAYDAYSQHPDHNAFVKTFWVTDVKDFLEIDFEPFK